MKVINILKNENPKQFFIFDSHQEMMNARGVSHQDIDYKVYTYNTKRNNKPKAGDVFVYRRPGKTTSNRKFVFYGGGIIDHIEPLDTSGNVAAHIKDSFQFVTPLMQGDPFLENFAWSPKLSKRKKSGSWERFWNQYGINQIEKIDFYNLFGGLECIPAANLNALPPSPREELEEKEPIPDNIHDSDFYLNLQQQKQDLGEAGEQFILNILSKEYPNAKIDHVSANEGDNYGYDIRLTLDNTIYKIEVKTTKTSYIDGFYLTPNELYASKNCAKNEHYQIYRVYNYNIETKTGDYRIYDAPLSKTDFLFEVASWKVRLR